MKKALLIVVIAIITVATTSAQYMETYEVQALPELSAIADTTPSPFTQVLCVLVVFYSLAVVVLTFKLFGLCENVKNLTQVVKNIEQKLTKDNQ